MQNLLRTKFRRSKTTQILSIEFPMISQTLAGIQTEKVEKEGKVDDKEKYSSFFHCASIR